MTSVLKRDESEVGAVRSLGVPAMVKAPSAEERRVATLEAEIEELHQALRDADAARLPDIEMAREEGRKNAEAAFRRDEERALAALEVGLSQAVERLDAHFKDSDKLGLAFALTVLEKIVADPGRHRDLIADCIQLQVSGLRRDTIASVVVSAEDFDGPAALDQLAQRLGGVAIAIDSSLPAGECRVDLRLGAIDISIPHYWASVQSRCRQLMDVERP